MIAYLPTTSFPILISDMLLSRGRSVQPLEDVYLPTLGFLKSVEKHVGVELPFEATRLVRKPFIVSSTLHIAWAGDLSAGEELRKNLIELTLAGMSVNDAFDESIARLDIERQQALSAIAVVLRGPQDLEQENGSVGSVLTHNCLEYRSPLWGTCFFGGSGAMSLQNWIATRDPDWARALRDEPEQFVAELICARLSFAETLMTSDDGGQPYAALLSNGCGGFYEASRFRRDGVLVPRNWIQLQFQYSNGTLRLTRLLTYSTGIPDRSAARQAIIWSFLGQPVDLVWNNGDATIFSSAADCVICLPFWDADTGKRPMQWIGVNPADTWSDRTAVFEVATVLLFEHTDLSLEEIERHSPEIHQQLLESTGGSRNQLFVYPLSTDAPVVDLAVDGDRLRISLKQAWLSELVRRFEASRAQPHVVVDR